MRFSIEHVFPLAPAAYEQLYFDEPFNAALGDALAMGRELRRLERTATKIVRHVCFEPNRPADAPANQIFGSSRASFLEELDYDIAARKGSWRTIPNRFADRVRNTGTIELAADAASGGTRRIVRGEVAVKAFGFGGLVERGVVAEIEQSYARTTAFTLDWIARAR